MYIKNVHAAAPMVWASYCFGLYSRTGTCCACIFSLIYPVFLCLFPFSADTAWPDFRRHGLAWLQCSRLGLWLGCKTPKQTNKWTEEQTNKLPYRLKALIIIHALKWKVTWWDYLLLFFRWGGVGRNILRGGKWGRGRGKLGVRGREAGVGDPPVHPHLYSGEGKVSADWQANKQVCYSLPCLIDWLYMVR